MWMMRLLILLTNWLASQRARVAVHSTVIASESTSANNTNRSRYRSTWSSCPWDSIRIGPILVLWLWLDDVDSRIDWECISCRHILTLTSSSWSLWSISLLMIWHKLFLLVIQHHLIDDLVVGYLFYQWSCCELDIRRPFYISPSHHSCWLLSTLLTWCASD